MATFNSPYEQYAARNGEPVTVTGIIDTPDSEHDAEVLPMYRVTFSDGVSIEAWPEEIHPLPAPADIPEG